MFKIIIQYTDALDICSMLNGLVFFAPVSLLVRTSAGISLQQFFLLQAIVTCITFLTEIPSGKLTDFIGYKNTFVLYQIFLLCARITLFIAHMSCIYYVFILQAILEGIAGSFASGTESAYIYLMYPKEKYTKKIAHVANAGTIGFFISTLAFSFLYSKSGMNGLLLLTILSNIVSVITALFIPKETNYMSQHHTLPSHSVNIFQFLIRKEVIALLIILATLNIGRILINFFYVENIIRCGINEIYLTPIIIGYSFIELLSEIIFNKTNRKNYHMLLIISFFVSACILCFLGISAINILIILSMLFLPLCLDIPTYLLNDIQNHMIDHSVYSYKRAELLSIFNIGVSFTEIIFLLGSSILADVGMRLCYVLLAMIFFITAIILCCISKKYKLFPD